MAWKVQRMESQKQKFVYLYQTHRFTMTDLCQECDISRPTGYALWDRYEKEGMEAFVARPRRHQNHPLKTSERIENAILEERKKHPRWGARKLLVLLERRGIKACPSETTVNIILKKHGLVTPRNKRGRTIQNQFPIFDPKESNEVWSADFKGKFPLGNRSYCYPLTIADSYSRFLFAIQGLEYTRTEECKPVFEKVFREFGLPLQIHTDNGPPFGCHMSLRRMSSFSVWLMDYGITPVYSDPGHPEQNGRHERMHRDLKAAATRPAKDTFRAQQRAFDAFLEEYNEVRPHEALGMKTPCQVHRLSPREYPERVGEWVYNARMAVKLVTVNGAMRWKSVGLVMISTALTTKYIGLDPIDDGLWLVYYRHVPLGYFCERTMKVYDLEKYQF